LFSSPQRKAAFVGLALAAVTSMALVIAAAGEPPTLTVAVDRSAIIGRSRLSLGVTHTQYSLDPWGDRPAVRRGSRLLRSIARYQNQHIYGWGAANPEPSPGVFRWRTLDRRIRLMRRLKVTPVITLCCAPDWMTRRGTETSSYPNQPPTPDHLGDFAELARRVALRYPDVHHYIVWNEMKGLYDHARRNWNYVAYTNLYNAVYRALKGVDPAIRVGGPYLVIGGTGSNALGRRGYASADPITVRDREVLDYWLGHKAGADFIVIDRPTKGDHDRNSYSHAEYLRLTAWFGSIARQLRARTQLPIWYAEDYFVDDSDWQFQAAGLASMLAAETRAGVATSLRWAPQGLRNAPNGGNKQNLFSDTQVPGGGRPFPAYSVYAAFARYFHRGTPLVRARVQGSAVDVLASSRATLLINRLHDRIRVQLDGRKMTLGPYTVRAVPRH
jgi:hypothetical protein